MSDPLQSGLHCTCYNFVPRGGKIVHVCSYVLLMIVALCVTHYNMDSHCIHKLNGPYVLQANMHGNVCMHSRVEYIYVFAGALHFV